MAATETPDWPEGRNPFAGTPSRVLKTDLGSIACFVDRPGWIFVLSSGHLAREHADVLLESCDAAVSRAAHVRFAHDWGGMTSFDTSSPSRMIAWTARNRRSVASSDVFIRSPFVAMAARAANLTMGNVLSVTNDYAAFQRKLIERGA